MRAPEISGLTCEVPRFGFGILDLVLGFRVWGYVDPKSRQYIIPKPLKAAQQAIIHVLHTCGAQVQVRFMAKGLRHSIQSGGFRLKG